MPRAKERQFSTDSRGNFQRDLGWKATETGFSQPRFYLGKKHSEAAINVLRLERAWLAVETRWQKMRARQAEGFVWDDETPRPLWDETTLRIGQAIARGELVVRLDLPTGLRDGTSELTLQMSSSWLLELQDDFGMVRLELADQAKQDLADAHHAAKAKKHADRAEWERRFVVSSKATLHQALDSYGEALRKKYVQVGGGGLSPSGKGFLNVLLFVKKNYRDVALKGLDCAELEAMQHFFEGRPPTAKGEPISAEWVKKCLKCVRNFVKWLHRTSEYSWRKPQDYEVSPARIASTPEENARGASRVSTFTVEELATLYEYSSDRIRLFMLLALNCAFGADSIRTLQVSEIADGFIRRKRFKTGVYGEWALWPQTVKAIEWQMQRREKSKETALILNRDGKALTSTASGNINQQIQNSWKNITYFQVHKDFPSFRYLPFNSLRDTSIDCVRQSSGHEIAMTQAAHGQTGKDELLDRYSNRLFSEVFEANRKMGELLAPMFLRVPSPFSDPVRHNTSISRGKLKAICSLRKLGKQYKEIAEELDVCIDTVRVYLRKAGL